MAKKKVAKKRKVLKYKAISKSTSPDHELLGEIIQTRRHEMKFSQKNVAQLLGHSQFWLSWLERGRFTFLRFGRREGYTLSDFGQLCQVLGLSSAECLIECNFVNQEDILEYAALIRAAAKKQQRAHA